MFRVPKTSYLPVVGLLAAVLVLLSIVTVTTYFNLDRGGKQARRVMDAQASAVISGMAAGLRTGWRHWVWNNESIQSLVQEMSTGDIAFISLIDEKGIILAHSDPDKVGTRLDNIEKLRTDINKTNQTGWFSDDNLYLTGRVITDEDYMSPGPGMKMRGRMMRHGQTSHHEEGLQPEIILIGLNTKTFKEAGKRQLQHALIMGGLLFVLGSAAIYFIFLVQNYRTIDRTLANLSAYTARIIDNMPNGLITLSADDEPIVVNSAARDIFGWGDVAAASLINDERIRFFAEQLSPGLQAGEVILEKEIDMSNVDGDHLPLAVSAAIVPSGFSDDSQPGSLFIIRDLRQIKELEDQVRQGEKLAAVGRLAAGVAHEVRNPLSSMRGLARFLSKDFDQKSRETEYLRVMIEEIDRLDRVMSSLLDFAKPRTPDLKPLSLNETARYTSDLINDDVRHRGISVREDMSPADPVILADRDQVIQAMLNILLNAVEAMTDGGRMTVSTRMNASEAVFMVEDSGPGIDPSEKSKLIDPFYTTKNKGSGLGLAQVASIMKNHKGRLELGGEPGMGARVSLVFPLHNDNQAAS